jgi:prepilin-type N-terminal cleavage/methylation domain-containing protein
MKQRHGISLIELLIAMAILGILLALLTAFLFSNQQVTNVQISNATLSNDVRLAHLRVGEIVAQAHYIYPSGQSLTINGTVYTTGSEALAVLVPRGTTYCDDPNETDRDYCGFAYVIVDRAPYAALLGPSAGTTNRVLVEFKKENLSWQQATRTSNTNPAINLLNWGADAEANPVADSVNVAATNLGAELTLSNIPALFDKEANFDRNGSSDTAAALIGGVRSTIALERTIRGNVVSVSRDNYVFSKAIPRSALPNAPH